MDGKQSLKPKTGYKSYIESFSFDEEGRRVLAENDAISFEIEVLPEEFVFHFQIKHWSPSSFKKILHDWEAVKEELKGKGFTVIPARCKWEDNHIRKFYKMTGFEHVGDWVNDKGVTVYEEYKVEF